MDPLYPPDMVGRGGRRGAITCNFMVNDMRSGVHVREEFINHGAIDGKVPSEC